MYMTDLSHAMKWWNYFKFSKSLEVKFYECGDIHGLIRTFGAEYGLTIISHFSYMIDDYAKELSVQHTKKAKLTEGNKQYLLETGVSPINEVITRWLNNSMKFMSQQN